MQTIIGSGGAIGVPLAKELTSYTDSIRLVSRNPVKVNEHDELFPLDVTDFNMLDEAVSGSEIAYVTIGFEYNSRVWEKVWPSFIGAVIDSCIKHNSKLVFFDNVYMYDRSEIPHMTEMSSVNPPSRKGRVRKTVQDMIIDAIGSGRLKAMITRSADFYGPFLRGSMIGQMVISNLLKNKDPMTFGDPDRIHTFTYTPDAGRAMALLGNTPDAYGQVWHLPTTKEKLTYNQWIDLIAGEMKKKARVRVIPVWVVKLMGIFSPVMREFPEMMYQYETDYIFDSSKFEKRFNTLATPPEKGVRDLLSHLVS